MEKFSEKEVAPPPSPQPMMLMAGAALEAEEKEVKTEPERTTPPETHVKEEQGKVEEKAAATTTTESKTEDGTQQETKLSEDKTAAETAKQTEIAKPEATHTTNPKEVSLLETFPPPPPPPTDAVPKPPLPRPTPLRANPVEGGIRPMTASTRRLSYSTLASSRQKRIKYGTGKHSGVELVPQPSDDLDDPLNWPSWKKDLNFGALLMTVALVGVMKTALVVVNVPLEKEYNRSSTAIAALTGGPLLFSALSGMAASTAARLWGKRPVYLAGTFAILFGSMWNAFLNSYDQALAARIFQGLGWGVFDSLVLGSIHDTYFEHERGLRIAIHYIVATATTWGGPLLGGLVSQHPTGYHLQFTILSVFQIVSVLLMVLAAPETVFDRQFASVNSSPLTAASPFSMQQQQRQQQQRSFPSIIRNIDAQMVMDYLRANAAPKPYSGPSVSSSILLQAPRALVAPTTVLLFVASFLPFATLWALISSLSLMFAHLPFELTPSSVGALMTAPFLLSTGTAAFFAVILPWWMAQQNKSNSQSGQSSKFFPQHMNMIAVGGGSILAFAALLTTGLYADTAMTPPSSATTAVDVSAASAAASASESSPFMINGIASRLSLPALSFLLGLLAAGAYALDATVRPLIRRSTQFTSSNLGVALRNTVDMEVGVGVWRAAAAGVFVLATPNLTWSWQLLKGLLVGTSVAQLGVAAGLGAVWWLYDGHIRRLDGRVMKCVDLSALKTTGSFFDMD